MPFEPELLTTEADETPLRAFQEQGDVLQANGETHPQQPEPTSEPAEAAAQTPEPPAQPSEAVEGSAVGGELAPASPVEMLRALETVVDGDFDEAQLAQAGWTPEALEEAQEFLNEIEDLAVEDPLGAADMLAQAYAASARSQVQAEAAEALRPVLAREHQASAADTLNQIAREFGREFVDRNGAAVAAMLSADGAEHYYSDPATQQARVRQAFQAAEYERLARLERGDDVKEAARAYPVQRDAFGLIDGRATRQPWPEQQQAAPPTSPQAPSQPATPRDPRSVHVEGGSSAPPAGYGQPPVPLTPEQQVKQAIRESAGLVSRDLFGRRFPLGTAE